MTLETDLYILRQLAFWQKEKKTSIASDGEF